MKKTICFILLSCFLCTTAFAAPLIEVNIEKRTVDISGVSENENGAVSVTVVKKEAAPSDIGASVLLYVLDTDENGNYNGQFLLPSQTAAGDYLVYVSEDENPAEFYFADSNELSECISDFAGADKDTIEGILSKYVKEKNVLGVSLEGDYAKYPKWSQKIMLYLIDEKAPETVTDIVSYFHMANEGAFIICGDAREASKALSKNLFNNEINENISLSALSEMLVSIRKTIDINSNKDIREYLYDNLRLASAVCTVNSATKGVMSDVLAEYNDVLKLDLDGHYKSAQIKVNKALTDKGFKNEEEIRDAFNKAVSSSKKPTSTGGGGSTSGSSSIGGGSSVISFPPASTQGQGNTENDKKPTFDDTADVPWAEEAITALCERGIISGYENGEFRPENLVTRAEFTKLVASFYDANEVNTEGISFSDVSENDWFAPYIRKGVANKIINGVGDSFLPYNSITREDAAVIIYRFLAGKTSFGNTASFSDKENISDYAAEAVEKLGGKGIINGMGDGSFMPKAHLTRAQAAVLLYSAIKSLE